MPVGLQPLGALIRGMEEAGASISSSAGGNLSTARFFNPARLGLANRQHADARGAIFIR
jgi:hypothetical protein